MQFDQTKAMLKHCMNKSSESTEFLVPHLTCLTNLCAHRWYNFRLSLSRQYLIIITTHHDHASSMCWQIMSMAWRKTAVTPLPMHWSYYGIAISHRYVEIYTYQNNEIILFADKFAMNAYPRQDTKEGNPSHHFRRTV